MSGYLLLLLFLFVSSLSAEPLLQSGNPVVGRLSGGEQLSYQIPLAKGDFARIVVDQVNVDLALDLQDSQGKQIFAWDQEHRNQGRETLEFVANETGNYQLQIRPVLKSALEGGYEIRLEEIHSATDQDRMLFEARNNLVEASQLAEQRKYEEALSIAERTVKLLEEVSGPESADSRRALNLVAQIHSGSGEYEKAEPLFLRTLEIQERILGTEHPDLAETCSFLAAMYSAMEDPAKAESFSARAVTIREKTLDRNHILTGEALMNYGDSLVDSQKFGKSEEVLKQAILTLETSASEDHPLYATALHSLAFLYDVVGNFSASLPIYQRELQCTEATKGIDSISVARVLQYIGRAQFRRGDYEQAEALYQRALEINQKLNDENGILVSRSNLANIYVARGDYDRGEQIYKEILEKREKAEKPVPMRIAHALVNLGEIANSKEDYKAAEAYLKRSLSIVDTIWNSERLEQGDVLTRLAQAYTGLKDYKSAEEVSRRALGIFEKIHGPDHPHVAEALNALAQIELLKQELDTAEPMFQRALIITEKSEGMKSPDLLEPLNGLADIYAKRENIQRAVEYQSRANEIVEHNLALAIATGSERQKLYTLLASAANMDRNIALHMLNAPEVAKAAELAVTSVFRFKGRVLDSMADTFSSLRSHSSPGDQALLEDLNKSTSLLAQRILYSPELANTPEFRQLEEKIEKLQDQMSRSSAEFASLREPATLDSIRTALPEGAVLIEYALYRPPGSKDQQYVAYVIPKLGEVRSRELGSSKIVDEAVNNLRQALREPSRTDATRLARVLHQQIIEPIAPFFGEATHLLISPDGSLNLVPFEPLIDSRNRYLVESYLCSYLTSGRDLLRLQVQRESKAGPAVLANPMFGERHRLIASAAGAGSDNRRSIITAADLSSVYFAPLSATGEEARAIKTFFQDAKVFLGKDATETKLKQIEAPRILHIATHGFFLTDPAATGAGSTIENPLLRSGLAFAGANTRQSGDEDGILTALEATGLNLWGTKLVTLSACDTALGTVRNGEGVYGLRRAFVLSGTESLVMSLWSISDNNTREMMTDYYQNLKQGLGRAESLRKVQLQMMKRPGRSHPFFWASFIQSGQWAPL